MASLAHLQGCAPYPSAELATIWQEILLYQFHDILPGSSITRVYAECLPRGALTTTTIELNPRLSVAAAWLTNLLEEPEAQMELPLEVTLKPFEIVTLRLAMLR